MLPSYFLTIVTSATRVSAVTHTNVSQPNFTNPAIRLQIFGSIGCNWEIVLNNHMQIEIMKYDA